MTARPSAVWPVRGRKTNARASIGPFIGREDELARIDRAFDGGARLVTILGPPGMGKTRLAQRWLELSATKFESEGGAWFIDLSAQGDPTGLEHAVASVLPRMNAAQLEDAELAEALRGAGATLLVLDNFEQIVSAGERVRAWCEAAPGLRVLVTSRERLGVDGEHVLDLPPLACPREDDDNDGVRACEAVQLLVARAEAAGGIAADARVLGALVRQLDGIPLAIELAAARTRLIPPEELGARLAQSHDVLARRARAGDRHATLASAIDWSWNLLSPAEQRTLAECSVFAGSFGIEAAEAVLSPGDEPVVDRVAALRDKSLVHVADDGRLALYVSIRAFASKKLGDGADAHAIRLRHAHHYADAARRFNEARTLQGAKPDGDMRVMLSRDGANLLAALAFVRALPARERTSDVVAELALGLTLLQGAPAELGLDALTEALADPALDTTLRARVLLSRQSLLNSVGRFEESLDDLRAIQALDVAPGMRVLALVMQGIQLRYQGRIGDAWECHASAIEPVEAHGSPRLRAMNTACMGRLHHDRGDFSAARQTNARAKEICVAIGDAWLEGLPLANVAQVAQEEQRFDEAARLLDEALARFRLAGEPHYSAVYSAVYGDLESERGEAELARRWYAAAARFFTGWLAHRHTALLYAAWGALEARHGSLADAEAHLSRARRAAARCPSPVVAAAVDLHEAHVALRKGDDASRWRERIARTADLAATSFDVRFAIRMLARALGGGDGIVVASNGEWFEAPGVPRVDLGRRGSLKRILRLLADRHASAPGVAAGRDALLAAGWPDERLHPEAASKRLRVAVATLRSLGLRDVLLTRDDGYLLDPAVRVRTAPSF
ncbi:MAG TPA: AAA family ATPase [Labilithrix sp.]